jgi:hypothetical protein
MAQQRSLSTLGFRGLYANLEEDTNMKGLAILSVREKKGWAVLVALALLLALLIGAAQSVWADHAAGHTEYLDFVSEGQREATSVTTWSIVALDCSVPDFSALAEGGRLESACEHRSTLVQLYQEGKLQYNAPGR